MPQKLSELAKKLGVTNAVLRTEIADLGFTIAKTASSLSDEIVAALEKKHAAPTPAPAKAAVTPVAEAPKKVAPVKEPEVVEAETPEAAPVPVVEEAPAAPELPTIELPEIVIVKDFASKLGRPVTELISTLIRNGIMATINAQLDFDTAAIIAEEMGFRAVPATEQEAEEGAFSEIDLGKLLSQNDPKTSVTRAPVISVIGHVDHGKTKLLDRIRGTAVMETEAGGITQRIGAYQVIVHGKPLTFLDTPGHEAFTIMRARGVKMTDIAILVVAADDGVMPQTVEAISHARDAGIPLVVAINKVDKPDANIERVKSQLAEHDVLVEGWGGKTICVPISALNGQGVDELLEMLLISTDLEELKADPAREPIGTVIESHKDQNLGPIATVLIHTGTLRQRDYVVIGATYGRIRAMYNYKGEIVQSAGPSVPVLISGLQEVPQTGDVLLRADGERDGREKSEAIKEGRAHQHRQRVGLSELSKKIAANEVKELKLILKADTKGSLEAIKSGIEKIPSGTVSARVIHAATGDVTSSDIMLAAVAGAVIVGFTVRAVPQIMKQAEFEGVDIRLYNVIYKLLEEVESAMRGLIAPEIVRVDLGLAKVLKIFFTGKGEMVAGVSITEGKIKKGAKVDVIRDQAEAGKGDLDDVRLVNESIDELSAPTECGIRFKSAFRLKPGDDLEVYMLEERLRTLEDES